MGTIFDVPSGLLFVLSLVTSNPNDVATAATGLAAPKSATAINLETAPCRHGEQAWFAALKHGAGGVAFSNLATRIFKTKGGRYYVPVRKDRDQIINLQRDNAVSCFIALSSAANSAHRLKLVLGRDATLTDLYVAHVFGAYHAARILKAAKATPRKRMAALFPTLDLIEPGLYSGRGSRMTVAGFRTRLQRVVRRQVDRAHGKTQARAKVRKGHPKGEKSALQRVKALVQNANISARDLLKRGPQLAGAQSQLKHVPRPLQRFGLGAGLAKNLLRTTRKKASRNSIAF